MKLPKYQACGEDRPCEKMQDALLGIVAAIVAVVVIGYILDPKSGAKPTGAPNQKGPPTDPKMGLGTTPSQVAEPAPDPEPKSVPEPEPEPAPAPAPAAPAAEDTCGSGSQAASKRDLSPGSPVRLEGLVKAAHLNGLVGTVLEFEKGKGRWVVAIPGASKASYLLKPANLVQVGVRVQCNVLLCVCVYRTYICTQCLKTHTTTLGTVGQSPLLHPRALWSTETHCARLVVVRPRGTGMAGQNPARRRRPTPLI